MRAPFFILDWDLPFQIFVVAIGNDSVPIRAILPP